MTSSWDSYYVVFLSALISLGIPAFLGLISLLLFPKNKFSRLKRPELNESKANRTVLGQRINVRFFLAINAALILITLALALIPCATSLHSADNNSTQHLHHLQQGLVAIITLAVFSVLGLLYSIRKGDMGWLSTFHKGK